MVEHFEVTPEHVTNEARLIEDLDLDSIDAIDMAIHIEQLTGKPVAEEELRELGTVGDVVDLVVGMSAPTS